MTAMVTYFEIPVADLERAVTFYSQVLDVELSWERVDGNEMAHFPDAESGITGSLALGDSYVPGDVGVRVYFGVASIDDVLDRVGAAGGQVAYPKTNVGSYGAVAEFIDTEGNRLGLSEPGG
ncbi:MAG: VOC family protein [Pseudomonadota bacterium]